MQEGETEVDEAIIFDFVFSGEQLTLTEQNKAIEEIMTNDIKIRHNIAELSEMEKINLLPFAEIKSEINGDIFKVKMIKIDTQGNKVAFVFLVSKN